MSKNLRRAATRVATAVTAAVLGVLSAPGTPAANAWIAVQDLPPDQFQVVLEIAEYQNAAQSTFPASVLCIDQLIWAAHSQGKGWVDNPECSTAVFECSKAALGSGRLLRITLVYRDPMRIDYVCALTGTQQ